MTNEVENLILDHLRAIRASQAAMALDISDLKSRMQAVEAHIATVVTSLAGSNLRLDHLEERVARIERRLELTAA